MKPAINHVHLRSLQAAADQLEAALPEPLQARLRELVQSDIALDSLEFAQLVAALRAGVRTRSSDLQLLHHWQAWHAFRSAYGLLKALHDHALFEPVHHPGSREGVCALAMTCCNALNQIHEEQPEVWWPRAWGRSPFGAEDGS